MLYRPNAPQFEEFALSNLVNGLTKAFSTFSTKAAATLLDEIMDQALWLKIPRVFPDLSG